MNVNEALQESLREDYEVVKDFGFPFILSMIFYVNWYRKNVKPKLDIDTKKGIMERISKLTLRKPIWVDPNENYIDRFPELEPFSKSKHISGLQLVSVMKAIVKELQEYY